MDVRDVKVGQHVIEAGGALYGDVACQFHNGESIVDQHDDGEPIFSDKAGFQPDCLGCYNQAALTVEHINAVEAHDAATERNSLLGQPMRFFTSDEHRDEWEQNELRKMGEIR